MTPRGPLVVAAEAGLCVLTLGAIVGMGRLLDGDWVWPLVLSAVAAHLVVATLRRLGVGLLLSAMITTVVAFGAVLAAGYGHTLRWLLPTAETWRAMDADLELAWEIFRDVRAPAPAEAGFLVVASLAIWFVAFIADWAAFRLWVPFEATLPAATLFIFCSLLGAPGGRTIAVAAFAASFLAFMLLHRVAREDATTNWVTTSPGVGQRTLLTAGGSLAVLALFGGLVVGPQLPGADAEPMVDYRGSLEGPDSRVTISPLVDIRSRLVSQSDVEVFTVRASARAYWRLTSLEQFDGRIWRSSGSFGSVDGSLPTSIEQAAGIEPIEQVFTIDALEMLWLPAAFEPVTLDAEQPVRFDEDSSTFIVDRSLDTSDGLTYRVSSEAPRFDPQTLNGASADSIPNGIAERYLGLPADFPASVADLTRTITADAATPYQQALALQEHFRDNFDYNLEVGPGHDEAALERFLFEDREGYCEQFAGAYAAMARTIGLPSRVAVGFTPGEVDPTDDEVFHVLGKHAHAWPEVYLAGTGWVPFEPTPGRGMPGAESHTGVPEQQQDQPPGLTPEGPGGSTTTTEPGPSPSLPNASDLTVPPGQTPDLGNPGAGGGGGGEDEDVLGRLLRPVGRVAPYVGLAVLAYAVVVPLLLLAWRFVRRRRATTPERRVELAWVETQEDAALLGVDATPSDTIAERARRIARRLADVADDATALSQRMEVVEYGPLGITDDASADAAAEEAARIRTAARSAASPWTRIRRWFDPRPLGRALVGGRVRGARRVTAAATTG